jgi:hypothetical protein
MIAKNVTMEEMELAMSHTSPMYNGNVTWNRYERKGRNIAFTLRVHSSKGAGAMISKRWSGQRRTINACWHVHGHFFEALFKIAPEAVIMSRGNKITKDSGNWEDFNVGSMAYPVYASECCHCKHN